MFGDGRLEDLYLHMCNYVSANPLFGLTWKNMAVLFLEHSQQIQDFKFEYPPPQKRRASISSSSDSRDPPPNAANDDEGSADLPSEAESFHESKEVVEIVHPPPQGYFSLSLSLSLTIECTPFLRETSLHPNFKSLSSLFAMQLCVANV